MVVRFDNLNNSSLRQHIIPYEKGIDDKNIVKAENCFYERDALRLRPGIKVDGENPIFYGSGSDAAEVSFITTDSYIFLDGEYGRVVISSYDTLMGSVTFKLGLVTNEGKTRELGSIEFVSVDQSYFGVPSSYTVFSGTPVIGKGIFFMVRQEYGGDIEDFVKVFELTPGGWVFLSESHFYTPTVLANGRGEGYHYATSGEKPLELPKPIKPEGRNLLSGRFSCCYTTDGVSSSFYLPYTQLDDSSIICEVTLSSGSYIWSIMTGAENSEKTLLDGVEVVALCDRATGRVYFKKSDGTDYQLAYTGRLNNLRITAAKTLKGEAVKPASKTAACKLEGDAFGFKSNVTLFYGGELCPSTVFWNSPYHPLYFSENNCANLGEQGLRVEKLITRGNEVLAFKENKLFSAEIKKPKNDATLSPVTQNGGAENADKYELSFSAKMNFGEKPVFRTVLRLGEGIFFATESGNVLKIGPTNKLEKVLSTESLDADCFAVLYKDAYMLVSEGRATVIKEKNGRYGVFLWSFPADIIDGLEYLGKTVLFTRFSDYGINIIYSATLGGNEDEALSMNDVILKTEKSDIKADFTVKIPDIEGRVKLQKLKLGAKAEKDVVITLSDNTGPLCEQTLRLKDQRGYLSLSAVSDEPQINFGFTGDFRFKGFVVDYRKLNKI